MTFKQLEAFFWVAQLGGFGPAALKLHATQSAISQRIRELEDALGLELFDRTARAARLTEKGEEVLSQAKRLLEMRDTMVEQVAHNETIERTIRIGVTELTAMTWLPRLVSKIQEHFPKVSIEPDIDMSSSLRLKLLSEEIDLMIVPDVYPDPAFSLQLIGTVENALMCHPNLLSGKKVSRLHDLGIFRLLVEKSGPGILYDKWFKTVGFKPANVMTSNSIVALLALTISGFGLSYFPKKALQPLVASGLLRTIEVKPALPPIRYVAAYKTNRQRQLTSSIIMLAQECCNFDHLLVPSEAFTS